MIWSLIPDWLFAAIGAGVGGFIMHFVGRWSGKREGASEANAKAMEADYENAEDIRRRVSIDRAKRVRELDDAGWRD
jgi:membrane protein DedA with SNARE-associated domain